MSLASPLNNPLRARKIVINRANQSGAALILALTVVVIVVLLASTMASDFLVSHRRIENQLHGKQASAYMRGAEGLARRILQLDYASGKQKDHISEGWLDVPQEFPMERGFFNGKICDLQGRFNLNNVATKPTAPALYTFDQAILIRLLQTLVLEQPLDQQQAEELTHALIDWIDKDGDISASGGAEAGFYGDLALPYRPANRPLNSVSELRWVRGFSDAIYRALEPHVTALAAGTSVNVNTAGLQVLRSLNPVTQLQPLTEGEAQALMVERDGHDTTDHATNGIERSSAQMNNGFDNTVGFINAHPAAALKQARLSVNSEYFLLDSSLMFMQRRFKLTSVINRDNAGNVKTIARGYSGLGHCYGYGNGNANSENEIINNGQPREL